MFVSEATHRNTVEFEVYGEYALFTDVLTRSGAEKCSYMIPTYEALKGILQSIYSKPTFTWFVDNVRVMNPICTVRKGMRPINYGGGNDLAYYTYLKDVRYQVRAHFEWNENHPELAADRCENKHHNIAKRMIERGGRRDIFLGTRECSAYVEPCVFRDGKGYYDDQENNHIGKISYNLMYYAMIYADQAEKDEDRDQMTVCFWNPTMENGVINLIRPSDCTVKRHIKKMPIKRFGKEFGNFTGLEEFRGGELI